jgi:hypothetical protein
MKLCRFEVNRLKIITIRQGPNCNYKKIIRDLNVKLQGLKYNFEKVQGVKCTIS